MLAAASWGRFLTSTESLSTTPLCGVIGTTRERARLALETISRFESMTCSRSVVAPVLVRLQTLWRLFLRVLRSIRERARPWDVADVKRPTVAIGARLQRHAVRAAVLALGQARLAPMRVGTRCGHVQKLAAGIRKLSSKPVGLGGKPKTSPRAGSLPTDTGRPSSRAVPRRLKCVARAEVLPPRFWWRIVLAE